MEFNPFELKKWIWRLFMAGFQNFWNVMMEVIGKVSHDFMGLSGLLG
jgi:hypothetical protein